MVVQYQCFKFNNFFTVTYTFLTLKGIFMRVYILAANFIRITVINTYIGLNSSKEEPSSQVLSKT